MEPPTDQTWDNMSTKIDDSVRLQIHTNVNKWINKEVQTVLLWIELQWINIEDKDGNRKPPISKYHSI